MKTLICIPCMDMVHTAFMQSLLQMRMVGEVRFGISSSSLIYDARNKIAEQAIEGDYDRCLWLDSDMIFPADMMEKMSAHLDNGLEIVTGLYFTRKNPIIPTIYKDCGYYENSDHKFVPSARSFLNYPKDSLVEIEGMGFGCVMHTVDMLREIKAKYGMPFTPVMGFGEDLSFCGRVIDSGRKIYADTSIKCGHIAQSIVTEETYETMGGARLAGQS